MADGVLHAPRPRPRRWKEREADASCRTIETLTMSSLPGRWMITGRRQADLR